MVTRNPSPNEKKKKRHCATASTCCYSDMPYGIIGMWLFLTREEH